MCSLRQAGVCTWVFGALKLVCFTVKECAADSSQVSQVNCGRDPRPPPPFFSSSR